MVNDDKNMLLCPPEVADLLRIKPQTLALWRCSGRSGLKFIRIGKAIRYRESDVFDFLKRNTGTSTAALNAERN